MTTYKDWRRQPFTGATYQVVLAEVHTVIFYDDWNAYGIQLAEGIYLENPSSVEIVENVTGGATFTEISRTTPPIAGQYRVDYEADTFTGTSRIEFNAADVGTEVLVTYKGLGLIASTDNYQNYLANKTVPGDFGVQDDLSVGGNADIDGNLSVGGTALITGNQTNQGDIALAGNLNIQGTIQDPSTADTIDVGSKIDMNSNKIEDLGTPTNNADATTKLYVDNLIATSIASALQNATVGAVGTYAFLQANAGTAYAPGDTASGAVLQYASADGAYGTAPTGTWRCMGQTSNAGGSASATLWLRIS